MMMTTNSTMKMMRRCDPERSRIGVAPSHRHISDIARGFPFVLLPLLYITAACGQQSKLPDNSRSVDINGAAEEARGDIDTYASNALQTPSEAATSAPLPPPRPSPTPTPAPSPTASSEEGPAAPGTPGGLADDRTPVSEAPFTPESAQGAGTVVQTYYALIEAGNYRQAWRLWGQQGAASGMSAEAFAASFSKYRDYHAEIGAPGRIDAGAGQRYITVSVQIYGHLSEGDRPFRRRGEVSLHRTADIAGATAEQKLWRISAIKLQPPADSTAPPPLGPIDSGPDDAVPATAEADYRCADGTAFHIAFDNRANTGTVSVGGKRLVVLDAQRAGSGIWYSGAGYTLRGKGNEARFTRPGKAPVECTAGSTAKRQD